MIVSVQQAKIHLWVILLETFQNGRKPVYRNRRKRPDPYCSRFKPSYGRSCLFNQFSTVQQRTHSRQQAFSFIRQVHASPTPPNHCKAEFFLQSCNAVADGALGNPIPLCSRRKAPGFNCFHQDCAFGK